MYLDEGLHHRFSVQLYHPRNPSTATPIVDPSFRKRDARRKTIQETSRRSLTSLFSCDSTETTTALSSMGWSDAAAALQSETSLDTTEDFSSDLHVLWEILDHAYQIYRKDVGGDEITSLQPSSDENVPAYGHIRKRSPEDTDVDIRHISMDTNYSYKLEDLEPRRRSVLGVTSPNVQKKRLVPRKISVKREPSLGFRRGTMSAQSSGSGLYGTGGTPSLRRVTMSAQESSGNNVYGPGTPLLKSNRTSVSNSEAIFGPGKPLFPPTPSVAEERRPSSPALSHITEVLDEQQTPFDVENEYYFFPRFTVVEQPSGAVDALQTPADNESKQGADKEAFLE